MEPELLVLARAADGGAGDDQRPSFYKAVGISLAVASGLFIGVSFVLKKVGLLRANEKYDEVAGEGYGYLKNFYWWSGMTLMILGEICNSVAYAFVDAILVTPLGALSVVVTAVLSAIFLKERLSLVGKISCFLCILGSVIITLNAPHNSSVSDIQGMQKYVVTPGFLTYAGVIVVGAAVTAIYAGPRWGNKNMLVYISICSWIGGLSVVATQGLGAAIIAWIDGAPQYKEWFLWVLFVFVIATLLTEIIYLNKALNIFNAALVTPTYYVYFTSTTIITSVILFQGFPGATVPQIITIVLGFLTICSGVVLLQLSKSAKDVPDSAVFKGDLDQIHTIAEQEQPESEPKADAIRGTAAIMRRISQARLRMEEDEFRRLHDEKEQDAMAPISEDGQPLYEWDGLRRRRTTISTAPRARSATSPQPTLSPGPHARSPHPPLGMSHFPLDEDPEDNDRSTIFSSIAGTIRNRGRTNASAPAHLQEEYKSDKARSPMHPVPLTEVAVPAHKEYAGTGGSDDDEDDEAGSYYGPTRKHVYRSHRELPPLPPDAHEQGDPLQQQQEWPASGSAHSLAPTPPPHSTKRQFSFQRVFRRSSGPTDEERMGLVKDDEGEPREAYI